MNYGTTMKAKSLKLIQEPEDTNRGTNWKNFSTRQGSTSKSTRSGPLWYIWLVMLLHKTIHFGFKYDKIKINCWEYAFGPNPINVLKIFCIKSKFWVNLIKIYGFLCLYIIFREGFIGLFRSAWLASLNFSARVGPLANPAIVVSNANLEIIEENEEKPDEDR